MTLKFPPIDQKCHKSFIILLKIKEKILWCLVSFIFRISPMIRGLKIDLWILVIWSKHFWGYFLNIEAVSYMWTFPNSCRPSEARSPTKHDNFPFVCVAVIHSKTSGNLPSLQGSKITEFNAKQKMEKPNSLENRVPHGARCCKPVTAPPSSCLHRPKGWRFMHSQEPNGKRVGGNVCMTVQESSMAIEIKRKAAGTIRLKVTDNN